MTSQTGAAKVLGQGCLCALGPDMDACLRALFAPPGTWAPPAPPRRFSTGHPRAYPVFELPEELLRSLPGDAGLMLTARLGLAAALEALRDAGLDDANTWKNLATARLGVCVGTTVGSAMNDEPFYRDYRQAPDPATPPDSPDMEAIQRYLRSNPASVIARELRNKGLRVGPVQTVCNACSSGADAIAVASSWLASGFCDIALAGGADELCRVTCNGFISLMIHSQNPARPFAKDRDGLNLGEGAAMLLLAREDIPWDGPPKGRVRGCGMRCDAHHLTAPHPQGRGLAAAVEEVLNSAGLEESDIAFVNAHGTGTRDNDRVEAAVLAQLLPNTVFFSSKGRTGHTLGAAGAIEAALTLGCLRQGRIPASAGCLESDPELPLHPLMEERNIQGEVALSFSLAFGGGNTVLALARD